MWTTTFTLYSPYSLFRIHLNLCFDPISLSLFFRRIFLVDIQNSRENHRWGSMHKHFLLYTDSISGNNVEAKLEKVLVVCKNIRVTLNIKNPRITISWHNLSIFIWAFSLKNLMSILCNEKPIQLVKHKTSNILD